MAVAETKNARVHATDATLDRYRLCFELASGGMATVFLARVARGPGFEKLVALKRIHPHLAKDPDFVEMFLDEARITSRLTHPNVCSVFDFGAADGTYFIAMEYILGETLSTVLKKLARDRDLLLAPEVVGYALRIIADACEGLHAAHELKGDRGESLGLVHRDVSPQNIFVAYDGTVRIVDFGVARAAGRLHETRSGVLKGKLAYMSPEQGRRLPLDRRSDVWGLGVVLWEMLAGKRLFHRETEVDTIMAALQDDIPQPSAIRQIEDAELDRIVGKALERDPEERYQTARELGRDLHRYLARLPEPVTSAEIAEWMGALFEKERDRRSAMVEQARSVGNVQHPEHVTEDTAPDLQTVRSEPRSDFHEIAIESSEPKSSTELRPVWKRHALLVWALLPIAIVAVALVVIFASSDDEPELASQLNEPPADQPPASRADISERAPIGGMQGASSLGSAEAPMVARVEPEPAMVEPAEMTRIELLGAPMVEASTITAMTAAMLEPRTTESAMVEPAMVEPAMVEPREAEAREREQSVRPPRATGDIQIATPGGWADVFLGGRSVGRSPGRITLPAGRHVLVLRPGGDGAARRVPVEVVAGEVRRVVVSLP